MKKTFKHLVTGSSGFVGSEIVKKLIDLGETVVAIDIIEDKDISKICEFHKIDISNPPDSFSSVFKDVKYVHHNAALVPLTKAGSDFFKANVNGTTNVLLNSKKNNVSHFSHMSSSAIFGKPKNNKSNFDYKNYNPTGIYGISKYKAELEVLKFKDKFQSYSIIRPRPIIGKGRLGIFEILFDWVSENKKIPVIGSGLNTFQFAHISDLVDVSIETAMKNISGTFNIGTDRFNTLKEDLNESFKLIGSKSRIFPINRYLCIVPLFILDKIKLSPLSSWHYLSYDWNFHYDLEETFKKLEWRPKYSNQEMVIEAYKWYIENKILIQNEHSIHRSKIKQKFLKVIKFFL